MAARKRNDIFVCGKDDKAMMHYFEMLTSERSSSEDEMDCDNIIPVAANQFHAADNETDNSYSESGEDNTAVDTSCGDVVDWKWEQSSVCIDESLMECRGQQRLIQFDKSKRARFRIKFYKLCDTANSYICDFKIDVGKDKTDGTLTSTAIVMEMMLKCDLLNKGYAIFPQTLLCRNKFLRYSSHQ
ncbi:hypothetical protein PR048_011312 [Dryococelus australis]|uniref:PiggyBac transposable element-derived protein domain-containing protein n=1 Tax=Dryococelus australis TaxID=614101 RepID=A0ABQ9HL94_9NEOP|nr:hypothetical protein PR048_011312 [Dryococelus australis]